MESSSKSALPQSAVTDPPYTVFDQKQKACIVSIVTIAATFSAIASNIYFPAIPGVAKDLNVSIESVNLSVTSYLVFQGLAPSLWGPISDVKGRRIAYCCSFIVFFCACIGLAELRNYATLVVLRGLQSTGSASTIAIGSGVIGDITTRANRGGYMGIFQAGLLVPVAVGPVIGGALAGSLGWRSIFWFLTIYSGVFLIFLATLLPETLRSVVVNGSRLPSNFITRFPLNLYQRTTTIQMDSQEAILPPAKRIQVLGPLRILVTNYAAPIIVFLAVNYAVWQMSITAMASLFQSRYGLSEAQIGLTFIANGVGSMVGTLLIGKILDSDYRKVERKLETQQPGCLPDTCMDNDYSHQASRNALSLERARLRLVPILCLTQCISILLFGWTIQYPHRITIAIPIISTFITGWTAVSTQSVVMTYLVDIFSDRSAAASASLNFARCLLAAGGTSFVMPMIDRIGVGPAFSVCAGAQLVAITGFVVQWRFAGEWRRKAMEKG